MPKESMKKRMVKKEKELGAEAGPES